MTFLRQNTGLVFGLTLNLPYLSSHHEYVIIPPPFLLFFYYLHDWGTFTVEFNSYVLEEFMLYSQFPIGLREVKRHFINSAYGLPQMHS